MVDTQTQSKAVGFSIILTVVPEEVGAMADFAKAFSITEEDTAMAMKNYPIVLLQNLIKLDVKAWTPTLVSLSKKGFEFRITASSVEKFPKVTWATPPSPGPSSTSKALSFSFTCPSCHESFALQRSEELPLGEVERVPKPPAPEAQEVAELRPFAETATEVEPVSVPTADLPSRSDLSACTAQAGTVEELPLLEPLEELEPSATDQAPPTVLESLEVIEEAPEDPPAASSPTPTAEEEVIELSEADLAVEATPSEPVPVEEFEVVEFQEESSPAVPEAPVTGLSKQESAPEVPPVSAAEPSAESLGDALPEPTEEKPAPCGYNFFLSRITDEAKRRKAAKLIASFQNISEEDAYAMTSRPVIPVLKDVTEGEAEKALKQFKQIQVFGRITGRTAT